MLPNRIMYSAGFFISLIVSVAMYIVWKKKFGKYLPYEDAMLLKLVVCSVICIGTIVSGLCISSGNKYAIIVGIIIFCITLLTLSIFTLYYKTIATKKW